MQSDDEDEETLAENAPPAPVRRSRTSEKRENESNETALAELAQALRSLSAGQLATMGISELVLDAIVDSKQIKSYAALERHMRFTRGLLRGEDWQPLVRRVDLVRAGLAIDHAEESGPAFEWTSKLLIQGDPALRRFMEEYPESDRRRVRQLMQNVSRATEARRAKARRILETAVHNAIEHARLENEKKQRRAEGRFVGGASAAPVKTSFYADLDDDDDASDTAPDAVDDDE